MGGAGFQVTYEPVSEPDGSRNASSAAKTNFWDHVTSLFGVTLAPDRGLAGFDMPGPSGTPRPMRFDATPCWGSAEGIPITPTDDGGGRNPYPLMRLVAGQNGERFSEPAPLTSKACVPYAREIRGNLASTPEPNSMRGRRDREKSEMCTAYFHSTMRPNGSEFAAALAAHKMCDASGKTVSPAILAAAFG